MSSSKLSDQSRIKKIALQHTSKYEYIENAVSENKLWGNSSFPVSENYVRDVSGRAFDRGAESEAVNRQASAVYSFGDRREALKATNLPCLVIHGEDDVLVLPEEGKEISSLIKDSEIKIFTSKDNEGLETIRHDTAHILAMAVQELYPGTQVTIGPVIENGFYYDFARKEPFTEDDLLKIENKMKEIVDRDEITKREVWERNKAISHFKDKGEVYKAELIETIPESEDVSIYFHGDWHDLCRGPHLSSTGKIGKFFKLTKVSGAYWRGDSNNEMLQRIYGTSWASQKDLDEYLKRIEEAEKRDHRKLGKEMDLFHFREESPGSVFWHEKGWALFQKLIDYMRMKQDIAGYKEINTPEVLDRTLWEKSGHWEKFGANMYTSTTPDEKIFAIKPMNCPGCVEVFNQGLKSYKDLPLKMSEFGKVHRYEPSGALHGLLLSLIHI